MSKVAWIIFISVVVLILGGLVVYSRISNPPIDISSIDGNGIIAASDQNGNIGDHTLGNVDSTVTLVEYGDFQCPSCAAAHTYVKEVTDEYQDKMLFIFRNFPLTTIHPNALAASGTAESAGLQDKYWEMHDILFENLSVWKDLTGQARTDQFVAYAVSLGLDKDQFLVDIAGEQVSKKISFDQTLGKKVGVNATPSFFLNGEKLDPAVANALVQGDTSGLKELIDKALGE